MAYIVGAYFFLQILGGGGGQNCFHSVHVQHGPCAGSNESEALEQRLAHCPRAT